ncbi:hypothetical protein ACQR09_31565 [Bradyrhizobium oligotrophicum]|uniref:hypothetical protein n=1 Tax=Bradyrhizobium oligotrophicum TaxID=44255 RepID=UPI003EB8A3A6
MPEWDEIRAAGIADAERTLGARADAAELRALVSRWMDATRLLNSPHPGGIAALPETVALADAFDRKGLGQLAEALRLLDQREGPIPPGSWLLASLLGSAVADSFADGLAAGERRPIEFRGLESYGAWDTFAADLVQRLRSDAVAQEGFWRVLASVVEEVCTEPERFTLPTMRTSIRATIEAYQRAPEVGEAWETKLDSYVLFDGGFLFAVALRIDAGRYLEHLGQLPHPVFAGQCVNERLCSDLPDLVREAPLAFDGTGVYLPEGMVVILLLNSCAAECRRRAWGDRATPRPVSPEDEGSLEPMRADLETFTRTVLDALFDRKDANLIGWVWLERLVYEGERSGYWRCDRQQGTGFVLDPLMILISRLSAKLEPRVDQLAWINEAQELWRVDRIAAVLAVAANKATRAALLSELIIATKPMYAGAVAAIGRRDCVVGRIGATHLLGAVEAERFIRDLWDELRPVREEAWRGNSGQARNGTAELAVLWAMCAMEMATAEIKRRLWLALRHVLESAMQTDYPSSPGGFWPAALRRLCQSTAAILTGAPADDLDILTELMRPRVRADDLFFEMVFVLQNAGVAQRLIEAAIDRWGHRLDDLATRYLAIEILRTEQGHLSRPWLKRIQLLTSPDPEISP